MDDRLAIHGGKPLAKKNNTRFNWPVIDEQVEKIILEQLHKTISIYDNSGIFGEFEKNFSKDHGKKHGLLFNSGTAAILAMYESIGILPGDEVICPVYTFHATISPLMYLGGVPIFCDVDGEGNPTLDEIVKKTTSKTRAVIVAHIWGHPVEEIAGIRDYCKKNKILLLEDCSHAHGATIGGKKTGTFGDISVWSLQGQKIITGGEGGILTTSIDDYYYRALLHGHYNKRPINEIPGGYELKKFSVTGFGLKQRAHPLAVAMAYDQYKRLTSFIEVKERFSRQFDDVLGRYPFISVPKRGDWQNSWYAYVFRFDQSKAFGISRELFVNALHAEGLAEFDIPGSTGLLNELPLFTEPNIVLPRNYMSALPAQTNFPKATKFQNTLIKLPVWAQKTDQRTIDLYLKGLYKVANYIQTNNSL